MTPGEKLKNILRDLATFTVRERRGILWFIPVIIVAGLVVSALSRPRMERGLQVLADTLRQVKASAAATTHQGGAGFAPHEGGANPVPQFFAFDPNTIDYRGLRALGFDPRAAAGIIKYRESGKVFRIKEDFAACWDVGDSIFYALERYITISPQFAVRKNTAGGNESYAPDGEPPARRDSLFTFDPNVAGIEEFRLLGFSLRQAEAIVRRREQSGGFRSPEEFGECYVVSGSMYQRLRDYISIPEPETAPPSKIELNTADSAALVTLSGVGPLTAGRIISYRSRLGGFAKPEQLAEVQGMTETNYERILQQISVDCDVIKKIDINFASPEKMSAHPYISPDMLRKIVKNRQLKGGWSTTQSMIEDGTITERQAARLAPYLVFNPISND